jgi:hypothetical protein
LLEIIFQKKSCRYARLERLKNRDDGIGIGIGVGERAVDAFVVHGGERWFVELAGFDDAGLCQAVDDHFDETDLLAAVATAVEEPAGLEMPPLQNASQMRSTCDLIVPVIM